MVPERTTLNRSSGWVCGAIRAPEASRTRCAYIPCFSGAPMNQADSSPGVVVEADHFAVLGRIGVGEPTSATALLIVQATSTATNECFTRISQCVVKGECRARRSFDSGCPFVSYFPQNRRAVAP